MKIKRPISSLPCCWLVSREFGSPTNSSRNTIAYFVLSASNVNICDLIRIRRRLQLRQRITHHTHFTSINKAQSIPNAVLVQLLWSIHEMNQTAMTAGYIHPYRTCCGLLRINSMIYDIPSELKHKIKQQPFVLRKTYKNNMAPKQKTLSDLYKPQKVHGPIASVHCWKLSRPAAIIMCRTLGCLVSVIFFPFLVVMQTTMFWCYCEEWGISNEGTSIETGDEVQNIAIRHVSARFLVHYLPAISSRSRCRKCDKLRLEIVIDAQQPQKRWTVSNRLVFPANQGAENCADFDYIRCYAISNVSHL